MEFNFIQKDFVRVRVNRPRAKAKVNSLTSGLTNRIIIFFLDKYNMIKMNLKYNSQHKHATKNK